MKQLISAIVYSNLWISLGSVAFTYSLSILVGYKVPAQFYLFIGVTTLFTYNFQRLVKIKFTHLQPMSGERVDWIKKHIYLVYAITIISFLAGLLSGWVYLLEATWLILIMSFLSFFYVWKLPFIGKNIRSIPTSKIFVLGVTWMIACGVVPFLLFSLVSFTLTVGFVFMSGFLFIFAISVPFDIRDIQVDNRSLSTIPQLIGLRKAKLLALLALWSSIVFVFLSAPGWTLPVVINAIFTSVMIWNSKVNKSELFYSGLVDATIILQAILLYFL